MNALTPTTSSTLTREISVLVEALQPVDNDTISKCIHWLIKSGLSLPGSITVDSFRQVYSVALAARATAAVRTVTEKLTRGDYGEDYARFIPTPAMFSALAANEQKRLVDDLDRAKAKANPQGDERTTPIPTPEQRANVRRTRELFKANTAALKRGEDHVPAATTDAERDYYAKLLNVPDRASITAEERQERNRIIAKMEMAS